MQENFQIRNKKISVGIDDFKKKLYA